MDEDRYRRAERALWEHWGVAPTEHRVPLASTGTTVRVLEIGDGDPVLFVHGGALGGSCWVDLASRFPDHRCLLLDRPGCALSEPLPAAPGVEGLPPLADRMVLDALDALGVPAAHLVSNSMGGFFTLRAAAAGPDRVRSVLHVGWTLGAPLDELPLFMRLASSPWLLPVTTRLPVPRPAVVAMLRASGLGRALDDGRIPPVAVDWNRAIQNHTDTRVHEYRATGRTNLRRQIESLLIPDGVLASISAPVTVLFGDEDPFGTSEAMARLVAALPDGHLEVWAGAGHAVWLDDLDRAAQTVRAAMARAGQGSTGPSTPDGAGG